MMHSSHRRLSFVTALVIAVAAGTATAQNAKQDAADAERLISVLGVSTGSVVGEIGAGDGTLTVAMAKAVGPTGRVYSNEINQKQLPVIRDAARKAAVENVAVVEGLTAATNLPDACCDAVFMRFVYHHFKDPAAMNASLMATLKPGGRLAVMDFGPPPGGEHVPPADRGNDGSHGVTAEAVERELKAAGFEILSSEQTGKPRAVLVVARKPAESRTAGCPYQ
jgi:ubiquinone/menaquinone biosynthesis C-methylase UbiE